MGNLKIVVLLLLGFTACKKKAVKQEEPIVEKPGPVEEPKAPQGTLLWDGDAAKGNSVWKVFSNIEGTGTITVVNDVTYGAVWKFDKPLGSHRTESHAAKEFQAKDGDDIYIGWRSKITSPPNIATNSVFQWKAYGDDMQQNFPIIFSTTSGGILQLMHYAPGKIGTQVWKTPLKINVWNRFVLRLKISRDGSVGFMEFWYNDEKQSLTGGTQRYYCRTLDAEYCDPKWGVYGGDAQQIINYIGKPRVATTFELANPEKLTEPAPDPIPEPATSPIDPQSLLIDKVITASSTLSGAKASNAVDDDLETYWQPLSADRTDLNIWLSVDMGSAKSFNAMRVFWNRADIITKYQLLYSSDGVNWQVGFEKTKAITTIDKSTFPKLTARYVKLNISLEDATSNLTTAEWRLFEE